MRRGALRHLLARPLVIVLSAFAVPVIIVAVVSIGAERPSAGLLLPSLFAAAIGMLCGGSIRDAARCSFAWTLPGYWRSVMSGFALAGMGTAALLTAMVALSGSDSAPLWLVTAAAFTAFVLAGAFAIGTQVAVAVFLLLLWAGSSFRSGAAAAAAAMAAPVATLAALTVCSATVLTLLVRPRTFFRLSAQAGAQSPAQGSWRSLVRRRDVEGMAGPAKPIRVGSSVTGVVLAELRADGVYVLLTAAAVALVSWLAFGPATLASVRYKPVPGLWIVWFALITAPKTSRLTTCRMTLPLPRRQQCQVAYALSACELLLIVAPSSIGIASNLPAAAPDVRHAVCLGIAATLCWYPAIQWARTRPNGGLWPDPILRVLAGFGTLVGLAVAINLVVSLLPVIVPSGIGQVAVLGLLFGASQAAHWGALDRFFAEADLVSNATT